MSYADGRQYVGAWAADKYHGEGSFTAANGTVTTGKWTDGKQA